MDKKIPIIIFDETSKADVLNIIGIRKDENNRLIDDQNKLITNQEFEVINFDEFGGTLIGSKVPIKKATIELVKYFVKKNEDE